MAPGDASAISTTAVDRPLLRRSRRPTNWRSRDGSRRIHRADSGSRHARAFRPHRGKPPESGGLRWTFVMTWFMRDPVDSLDHEGPERLGDHPGRLDPDRPFRGPARSATRRRSSISPLIDLIAAVGLVDGEHLGRHHVAARRHEPPDPRGVLPRHRLERNYDDGGVPDARGGVFGGVVAGCSRRLRRLRP